MNYCCKRVYIYSLAIPVKDSGLYNTDTSLLHTVILPAPTEFINIAYVALYYKLIQLLFQWYQTLYIGTKCNCLVNLGTYI